jgi:hypothetical protein
MTDWSAWHHDYADPLSALSQRLQVVQQHIRSWLDVTAPAPVTIVSMCAGDGRDLLEALDGRPDGDRVTATLVETDERNAERARAHVTRLALPGIQVRRSDAGNTDAYAGAVPADLVLACGIFGNIDDHDVRRTIAALPQLCAQEATVVWTRHREAPDLTPRIRTWFAEHDFKEIGFTAPSATTWAVGAHRFCGQPAPLIAGQEMFTFIR